MERTERESYSGSNSKRNAPTNMIYIILPTEVCDEIIPYGAPDEDGVDYVYEPAEIVSSSTELKEKCGPNDANKTLRPLGIPWVELEVEDGLDEENSRQSIQRVMSTLPR